MIFSKKSQLEKRLKAKLTCEVSFGASAKALYATDSSNYRQVPIAVVTPRTADDIRETVKICHSLDIPVLMRGGGTGLAGQTCSVAVVMDTSQYYNQILEINAEKGFARVQPGIVLDEVRNAAEKFKLTFAPDPATHSRCTIGGMIGNNSCGVHSVMAGKTVENIISLKVLTYDGTEMEVTATSDEEYQKIIESGGRKAEIYKGLRKIRDSYQDLIRKKYPKIPRRVSGYNLDELLPENNFDVAKALVGTEGTCVTILEATLRLVKSPQVRTLAVMGFNDIEHAGRAVTKVIEFKPIGLEGLDEILVNNMKIKNIHPESVKALPKGQAWLMVEFGSDSEEENKKTAEALQKVAPAISGFQDIKIFFDKAEQKNLWNVRESGLGATAFLPGQPDTWEGWEDSAVPPEKVGDYLRDLKKLYAKFNYTGALYGHFGQGCIHTRINFELKTAEGLKIYHQFISEAADLVVSYGGSLSGEHGDGQSKAEFLPKMFGPEIIHAFEQFKDLWDPKNKLNPKKIVRPFSNLENLRLGTSYAPKEPKTYFNYPEDGGSFSRAVLRCVGVGLCRRHGEGVMCPSYMVTREEKHATRGRTHLLFEMLRGETIKKGWDSPEVKEALDLCLACKGCKGECPTNVDMATYKAEFLAHYYKNNFRPRHAYAMGQIYIVCLFVQWIPRIANFFTQTPFFGTIAKTLAGIHPSRQIPKFAPKSFRRSYKQTTPDPAKPKVLLWVDTFTNSFHPQIAEAALRVLKQAGFEVLIPRKSHCCGRPLYDFGFLDQAKSYLEGILKDFQTEIREGIPFVYLEPSCCSVFRDELTNLLPHDIDAFRLSKQAYMLSEFLIQKAPNFQWPHLEGDALIQGHCHHKSVLKFSAEEEALKKTGLHLNVMDSGCCGMAGAFGFSKEHYDISQAAGERVMFPKLKESKPDALIIANGFSCREQIFQKSGRQAKHIAEVLDQR